MYGQNMLYISIAIKRIAQTWINITVLPKDACIAMRPCVFRTSAFNQNQTSSLLHGSALTCVQPMLLCVVGLQNPALILLYS